MDAASNSFDHIDISVSIAYLLAIKDEQEISLMTKAAGATDDLYTKFLKEEITETIDSDKKVKHFKLSDDVDKAATQKKYIRNLDPAQVDLCYSPIIQSGGNYNLKFSAQRYD